MSEEPPWEWVAGDPVRAGQFGLISGIFIGAFGALLVVYGLGIVAMVTGGPFPNVGAFGWASLVVALATANFLFLYLFPRRYPIVGRLGISPVGIRMVLLVRGTTLPWPQVRDVGPDWVDVSSGSALRQRYRLTPKQGERLNQFLGTWRHGPAAS